MNKILLTSAALALILFGACSGADKSEKDSKQDTAPVVKTMQVNDREVNQIGNYTATVEPELINNISSSAPNRIKQILVDEGMRVSAGQRLVVMDDINTTSYRLQLDNAKANLRNIEVDYNRALELYKIGGGTKQQVDQMETQLVNAKNAVASAERTLRNMNENTVLTSPISGVVTARNYDPGDMTGSLPILTVARTQPVKIIVNVSESELSKVRRGMRQRDFQRHRDSCVSNGRSRIPYVRGRGDPFKFRQPYTSRYVRTRGTQSRHSTPRCRARQGCCKATRIRQPLRIRI